MKVYITIPQNIVNTCRDNGWHDSETKQLFQRYLSEVTTDGYNQFKANFENWLEDLDEEELEQELVPFEPTPINVGDSVEIVANTTRSDLKVGDVGVVTSKDNNAYFVRVPGIDSDCCWHAFSDLEVIKY